MNELSTAGNYARQYNWQHLSHCQKTVDGAKSDLMNQLSMEGLMEHQKC